MAVVDMYSMSKTVQPIIYDLSVNFSELAKLYGCCNDNSYGFYMYVL